MPLPAPTVPTKVSLSSVITQLAETKGGKRLRQLRDRVMTALSLLEERTTIPDIYFCDSGLSLTSASTLRMHGGPFHLPSSKVNAQTKAGVKLFVGADPLADFVLVEMITPGKLGNNVKLTVASPGTAAWSESNVDSTDHVATPPTATLTPESGDVDATVAIVNDPANGSKILKATKFGTPGSLAAVPQQNLAGGKGEGVALKVGQGLIQDTRTPNALFGGLSGGAGSWITQWDALLVEAIVDDDHMAAGASSAVPTGETIAALDLIKVALFWLDPTVQAHIMATVIA